MSSKDPLASMTEGATKAALDFSKENVPNLIQKFRNRDIAFVEDIDTIKVVKEQKKLQNLIFFVE